MSNDENANESEQATTSDESVNKSQEATPENKAEEVTSAKSANEVEEATSTATEETASNVVTGIMSKLMELKASNPKVFFGGIGGIVAVILIMMMGGSDNKSAAQSSTISVGQTYTIRMANTYDPKATIRLVAVPGSMAAYDDTEVADRDGDCKRTAQGAKVKAIQVQSAFKTTQFVQIEMLEGECAGQKGWTIATNLH